MRIEWYGKKLLKDLEKPIVDKLLKKAGFKVEAKTKQLLSIEKTIGGKHIPAPYGKPPHLDTGRLRASISTNWSKSGMSRGRTESKAQEDDGVGEPNEPLTVVVGTNTEYGQRLELGQGCHPHPYLRPAFQSVKISEGLK